MKKSKSIAALVGPTLIVMVSAELKEWNPTLYEEQIVPVVYLSGVLLFVSGLAILRSHWIYQWNWTILVTIVGWWSILLGVVRLFFPQLYLVHSFTSTGTFIVELFLIVLGLFLSFKAYWPEKIR